MRKAKGKRGKANSSKTEMTEATAGTRRSFPSPPSSSSSPSASRPPSLPSHTLPSALPQTSSSQKPPRTQSSSQSAASSGSELLPSFLVRLKHLMGEKAGEGTEEGRVGKKTGGERTGEEAGKAGSFGGQETASSETTPPEIPLSEIATLRDEAVSHLEETRQRRQQCGIDEAAKSLEERLWMHVLAVLDKAIHVRGQQKRRALLQRLHRSLTQPPRDEIGEVDMRYWQGYGDIWTSSLWVIHGRDKSGAHDGWYWGNFVPQIPRQLMLRYTRRGEWVLDPFLGSGTTLIECRRLGRNGVGIELNPDVARKASEFVACEPNPFGVRTEVLVGNAMRLMELPNLPVPSFQFVILHPPYHDIIRFSDSEDDLSNASTTDDFLAMWREVIEGATSLLDNGRFLAIVIGDKYEKGEWVPLGFRVMEVALETGLSLKSIIVKNFGRTRGKLGQEALWKYRALKGGFYLFGHEYVFVMQKRKAVPKRFAKGETARWKRQQ